MQRNHRVFVWLTPDGTPFFIGRHCDSKSIPGHLMLWGKRKLRRSQLNDLLCLLDEPPRLSTEAPDMPLSKEQAAAIFDSLQAKYKDARGMLSPRYTDRPKSSYVAGWKGPRPVVNVKSGEVYGSVRKAATASGLSPAAITLACQRGKAWRYQDERNAA